MGVNPYALLKRANFLKRNFYQWGVILLALGVQGGVSGCASQGLGVGVERGMILPPGAIQTQLKLNQQFMMAVPIDDPMPIFPASAEGWKGGTVCIEFVVTGEGRVIAPKQIDSAPNCGKYGDEKTSLLAKESLRAVSKWTFFGAALCEYKSDESECDSGVANITPVDITLAYRFVFSVSGGRKVVRANSMD